MSTEKKLKFKEGLDLAPSGLTVKEWMNLGPTGWLCVWTREDEYRRYFVKIPKITGVALSTSRDLILLYDNTSPWQMTVRAFKSSPQKVVEKICECIK